MATKVKPARCPACKSFRAKWEWTRDQIRALAPEFDLCYARTFPERYLEGMESCG